ncbi:PLASMODESMATA CALLOSE-BINDING PROTEIN 3-like [Dioscorea cayenensis subsp. rotundata]|uniref:PLASMODESMATA CALLOSE-BINDING PROTEIN 3-like n=1 Tax=Dioscorea cayennensis subsp. rotundata TaxID=55577 RepID=A0AB40BFW4_DIOCR|nr:PLASMODESMATA CALLOSE-BINDING PROTEIN 3-like [Dioscorea cayenensis subsp. rotundata]
MGVGSPVVILKLVLTVIMVLGTAEAASWCVARSGASATALQSALDYACGAGAADCVPILPNGLCYLPNTLQSHASYAFNGYFQRSNQAPGSCDFSGTATTTISDPSYGSCTYPSSAGSAGGTTPPPPNTPNSPFTPSPPVTPSPGAFTPGFSPPNFNFSPPSFGSPDDTSKAPPCLSFFFFSGLLYQLLLVLF